MSRKRMPKPEARPTAFSCRMAVAVLVSTIVAAGCGAKEEPVLRSSAIELSGALAFRDGDPSIAIVHPSDGSLMLSPITVRVETENFRLRPAGATRDGEGHLHILIDQGCKSVGVVIDSGPDVVDLYDGRFEAELELQPGQYEICVQVGDGFHAAVEIVDRLSISVLDPEDFGRRSEPAEGPSDSSVSG